MTTPMNENDARDLLAWYAAGALEPEERAAVDAVLAESASLREELAQLRVMEEAVADTAGEPQWNPALITQTLQRVEAYEAEKAAPSGAGRLAAWLRENLFAGWDGVPTLAKAAVAAQFALLLAVGGAWLAQPGPADYGTAGLTPNAVRLKLQFQPTIDEATLRKTLRELDAKIVDGPSALGLYTVQLNDVERGQDEEIARILAELLARPDVVGFAERGD